MRLELTYLQKCKAVFHVIQAILIFIATCMTVAMFTKGGTMDGRPQWYFALCFLSAPALVYQLMVPMWSRAERFANVYAYLTIDALFTVFWFSAAASVITWNVAGRRQAAEEGKFPAEWPRNCSHFAFGPPSKCELSRVTTGFGFIIFVFFGLTTAMAVYLLNQYRKTGEMPRPKPEYKAPADEELQGGHDNTWSSSTRDIADPFGDDAAIHESRSGYSRNRQDDDDEYTALNSTETEHGRHPGRPPKWDNDGHDGIDRQNTDYYRAHPPTALSPDDYEDTSYHSSSTRSRGPGGYSFGRDDHR